MSAQNSAGARQRVFEALQHPLRRELLKLVVVHEELTPSESAQLLDEKLTDVSYHMRKLADRGLVWLDHMGQARGAAVHFYVPGPVLEEFPWIREAIGLPPPSSG
jgi:DNA-binding transcriptional ArsR family regulator